MDLLRAFDSQFGFRKTGLTILKVLADQRELGTSFGVLCLQ